MYVSLQIGHSVGEDPDADTDTRPAAQSDTEQADEPEELKPLPTNEVATEDLHQPTTHPDNASNKSTDQSVDPDDLFEVDIDCPLPVTSGKKHPYPATLMDLIGCRCHQEGTLQLVPFPKVGLNTPYLSSLKGTHRRVH